LTAGSRDAVAAFKGHCQHPALFISRRDRRGTDVLEHRWWREAGIDPSKGSRHGDIGGAVLFSSRVVIVKKTSFKSS